MCGHTRKDNIQNDHIRESVEVAPITEKSVENRLTLFEHVQKQPIDALVRRMDQTIQSPIKRERETKQIVKENLGAKDLANADTNPKICIMH